MNKKRVLLLEDARDYQVLVASALSSDCELCVVDSVESAMDAIQKEDYDLYILDVVLPDSSGLEVCSYIKSQDKLKSSPVILLTGQSTIDEKLLGFEYGADDYITKPFDVREFKARVKVKLNSSVNIANSVFKLKGYQVNVDSQTVFDPENKEVDLTRIEFKLLQLFCRRQGHVLSRENILDQVWPQNMNVSERTVDSHISNLRKKTGDLGSMIKAVHGSGYKLAG